MHRCTVIGNRIIPPDGFKGMCIVEVVLDAASYPLERHYRYARHDESGEYTFPHFTFSEKPPGIRVGPWPGWQGISELPPITLRTDDMSVIGQFQFMGNEGETNSLHVAFRADITLRTELTISCDDERLFPTRARVYRTRSIAAEDRTVEIDPNLIGSYPRLLFSRQDVEHLRFRARSTHSDFHSRIRALVEQWDLSPVKTTESKLPTGPERLFPEDRVVVSSFLALVEQERVDIDRAVQALLEYVSIVTHPAFEPLKIDTQSGEVLFTLCIGFDWLHAVLTEEQRSNVEMILTMVADVCLKYLPEARTDYAQAHFLGCGLGLLAYSILFWEKDAKASAMASRLRGVLERIVSLLPDDGFYPHGINLWSYEHGFLLRWLELFRHCFNDDCWKRTEYWKNASRFRVSVTSHDGLYGITFGDPQFRVGGDAWCHDLIAARTGSTEAARLAHALRFLPVDGVDFRHTPARRRVWEFLFHHPAAIRDEETSFREVFQDGGQVNVRYGKRLVVVRCGKPLGSSRYEGGETGGYGHADPCNGSFLVHDDGDFVISGPGPSYRRSTTLQNVITIDGRGQIGDRCVWLPDVFPPDAFPEPVNISGSEDETILGMNLTRCYLPELQIKRYTRHMLIRDDIVLGIDRLELENSSEIEFNVHTWGRFEQNGDNHWRIVGRKTSYDLFVLSWYPFTVETGLSEFVPGYTHDGTRDAFLKCSTVGDRVDFYWFLGQEMAHRPAVRPQLDAMMVEWNGHRRLFDGQGFQALV